MIKSVDFNEQLIRLNNEVTENCAHFCSKNRVTKWKQCLCKLENHTLRNSVFDDSQNY